MQKQTKQTKCNKHPYSPIIYVCAKKQCQITLCIICIHEHNILHSNAKTLPLYFQITKWYHHIKNSLQSYINDTSIKFNQVVRIFIKQENILNQINQDKKTISHNIYQIRTHCIDIINRYFSTYQQILYSNINNSIHNLGLLSPQDLQKHKNNLQMNLKLLNQCNDDLNESNYLKLYPQIKKIVSKEIQILSQKKKYQNINSYNISLKLQLDSLSKQKLIINLQNVLKTIFEDNLKQRIQIIRKNRISKIKRRRNINKQNQGAKDISKNVNWALPLTKQINIEQKLYNTSRPFIPNNHTQFLHPIQYNSFNTTFPNRNFHVNNQKLKYDKYPIKLNEKLEASNQNLQRSYHLSSNLMSPLKFSKSNSLRLNSFKNNIARHQELLKPIYRHQKEKFYANLQHLKQ